MTNGFGISRILVPLDGSENAERALPWAKALAGDSVEVVLMAVVPVANPVRTLSGQVISTEDEIRSKYQEIAEAQLADAKQRWFGDAANVSLTVAEGEPVEQILWTAAEQRADLVVMSSHGRGALGRFTSGSVADRIMREAPLPVVVVGPESPFAAEQTISRVLAPVDGSPLSMAALPVAGAIAKLLRVPVHVITVVGSSIEEVPPVYAGIPPVPGDFYEEMAESQQEGSEQTVQRAVDELQGMGVDASGDVYNGGVARSIIDAIQPGDILVLSSHGRSGLPRWVLGSTAMKLIRSAHAPVAVVTREYLEAQGVTA